MSPWTRHVVLFALGWSWGTFTAWYSGVPFWQMNTAGIILFFAVPVVASIALVKFENTFYGKRK